MGKFKSVFVFGSLVLLVFGGNLQAEDINVPYPFSSGTTIRSSEMNENFQVIYDKMNNVLQRLTALETSNTSLIDRTPTETEAIMIYAVGQYTGNMNGLEGANDLCDANQGKPAGYTYYRAFLSTQNISLISTFNFPSIPLNKPIQARQGKQISVDYYGMFDGGIDEPIQNVSPYRIWTGAFANGETNTGSTCADWTSTSGSSSVGVSGSTDGGWIDYRSADCDDQYTLLCLAY